MLILIVFTLKEDITNRINYEIHDMKRKTEICIEEYYKYECQPETRVPQLVALCQEKEKCFTSNPEIEIGKTRTVLLVFIDIINEIFGKISWNSLFGLLIVYFSFVLTIFLFIKINKK